MLNLLAFFEGEDANALGNSGWIMLAMLGLVIVFFIVMNVVSSKKAKKRDEEMKSRLSIGCTVTTRGGIVGELVEMDDKHIWLALGEGDNRVVVKFIRQAIYLIDPLPGTPEAKEIAQHEKEDEIDEIK